LLRLYERHSDMEIVQRYGNLVLNGLKSRHWGAAHQTGKRESPIVKTINDQLKRKSY
jgi:hypothetical protein